MAAAEGRGQVRRSEGVCGWLERCAEQGREVAGREKARVYLASERAVVVAA